MVDLGVMVTLLSRATNAEERERDALRKLEELHGAVRRLLAANADVVWAKNRRDDGVEELTQLVGG